jgi:hypothetical protein
MPTPIGSSGVDLLQKADALLQRAAQRVQTSPDRAVDAALDVVDARFAAASGAALIRTERDVARSALDILA